MQELAIAGLHQACMPGQIPADSGIEAVPCTSRETRKYQ